MHPQIRQDSPGTCPLCGMKLVLQSELEKKSNKVTSEKSSYTPLLIIIGLIFTTSLLISFITNFNIHTVVRYFMIGFFLIFSGFKLTDIRGFAEGYATYDLLAKRVYWYGYIYPFLELFFAFTMILDIYTKQILFAEIIVMGFSGIGVAIKILKHEKFQCVCLGTFLKVPLTWVTLVEDFSMVVFALYLLVS
ncbi:MAG TPA: MauE/DoxX family redox-associated membrane protein [Patescibacteria group bacterium]|nr:MauE/DoxX family redox-associated membrane protein [Patescibacteria group bacterium]